MELVPVNFINTKPRQFSVMGAVCVICSEAFNDKNRIPKILECGHTICLACIKKCIESIQVSYYGDGDGGVSKNFKCVLCQNSMVISDKGANGFVTNFQLLDTLKPNDELYVNCSECGMQGWEKSYHICRECTIEKHKFDVHSLLTEKPDIKLDTYAICSDCVLKDHNKPCHKIVKLVPLKIDWQFHRNVLSANSAKADLDNRFANVRTVLATTPLLIEKIEKETGEMVDLMRRSRTSIQQHQVMKRYVAEMELVKKVIINLNAKVGDLNKSLQEKHQTLKQENENLNNSTEKDVIPLEKALKIEKVVEKAEPVEEKEAEIAGKVAEKGVGKQFFLNVWEMITNLIPQKKSSEDDSEKVEPIGFASYGKTSQVVILGFAFFYILAIILLIFKKLF